MWWVLIHTLHLPKSGLKTKLSTNRPCKGIVWLIYWCSHLLGLRAQEIHLIFISRHRPNIDRCRLIRSRLKSAPCERAPSANNKFQNVKVLGQVGPESLICTARFVHDCYSHRAQAHSVLIINSKMLLLMLG